MKEPILCYVEDCWAYFTTQSLADQWGDDWNDAPYEHNSGPPYTYHESDERRGKEPWEIVRLAWDGAFDTPSDWTSNSHWSVEAINRGEIAWLRPSWNMHTVSIHAGTTMSEFIAKVKSAGGQVYVEA